METAIDLLQRFGLPLVFFNVLLTEGGLPLPVTPTLVTAGALAVMGGHGVGVIIATAAAGSLLADLCWYYGGRHLGRGMLRTLCLVSLSPDSCVRQTETLFGRFGAWSLLVVKFFPGLTTITVSLAGITRTPLWLFLLLDLAGGTLFVSVPVLLGWLFHDAIADILATLARFGVAGLLTVIAAFALYLAAKWLQRWSFSRKLRMARIGVDELIALIDGGRPPLILDVRAREARLRDGVIPGAQPGHPAEIDVAAHRHARHREIVVYCTCPNEASAAIACQHLRRAGFTRIRPLKGGLDAWIAAGRAVTPATA